MLLKFNVRVMTYLQKVYRFPYSTDNLENKTVSYLLYDLSSLTDSLL